MHWNDRGRATAGRHQALRLSTALASFAYMILLTPANAQNQTPTNAQNQTPASTQDQSPEEVVVTGTLIRGVAPAGSEVIDISSADVAATGAVTTDQLLASVPQVANFFNNLPEVGSGSNTNLQINRPNLRSLPGINTSTGAATLILVDGHRVVGAGVNQDAPDPDVVPPSVIQRVEISTDGGSAIYGADAVGGVINFITKRSFDGAEVDYRYGHADDYNSNDVAGTFGYGWDNGSAYLSYGYTTHDALYARDRSYIKSIDWNPEPVVPTGNGSTYMTSTTGTTTGVPTGRQCAQPNILVGSDSYAVLNGAPGALGTENVCDSGKDATFYPAEDRHNVYFGVSEDFTNSIKFDMRAFFVQRTDISNGGSSTTTGNTFATSVSVNPSNPFYQNLPGAESGKTQTVEFNFNPVLGLDPTVQRLQLDEWGVTPTLSVDLGSDWQLRTMFNYGESTTTFFTREPNEADIAAYAAGTTIATALDPYDIALTNPQLIQNIYDYEDSGRGDAGLLDMRAIADGSVVQLPGGTMHAAAGIEYMKDSFRSRYGQGVLGTVESDPFNSYARHVRAVFMEAQIPIFGDHFTLPGIESLQLEGAARYDDYSDFGETINPQAGVTWQPVDWIKVRGKWGTSFNAPTPVDELGTKDNMLLAQQGYAIAPPTANYASPSCANTAGVCPAVPPNAYYITLEGTEKGIQPETGRTKSVGFEFDPPFVPGLSATLDYYHINFSGTLGKAPIFNIPTYFQNYSQDIIVSPTPAQIAAFAAMAPINGAQIVSQFIQPAPGGGWMFKPGAPPVYSLSLYEEQNLGNTDIGGFDWSMKYTHDTDFGSVDGSVTANNAMIYRQQQASSLPWTNALKFGDKFNYAATIGANVGNLRAQATLNHSSGYRTLVTTTDPQDHVGSFNVVNLYFVYDLDGSGLYKNTTLSLNINNLFDQDPPVSEAYGAPVGGLGGGYTNGSTIGREFEIGISKKF